jgi:hypothetical protein
MFLSGSPVAQVWSRVAGAEQDDVQRGSSFRGRLFRKVPPAAKAATHPKRRAIGNVTPKGVTRRGKACGREGRFRVSCQEYRQRTGKDREERACAGSAQHGRHDNAAPQRGQRARPGR